MEFTFRKLNASDTFLMFKILSKIGLNDFVECFGKDTIQKMIGAKFNEDNTTMFGISVMFEIANVVMANLPKCENEIYQMLSNVSGLGVDQVRNLDMCDFAQMIIEFVKKDEFRDFIKVVSKSFNLAN